MNRMLLFAFVSGCVVSLIGSQLVSGAGTFLYLVPLMWAWDILATLFGTDFANGHSYLGPLVAAPMHGLLVALLTLVVGRALRRVVTRERVRPVLSLGLVTVVYFLLYVFAFRLTDGP